MISLPPATLGDEAALRQIREHADRLGIKLQLAHRLGLPELASRSTRSRARSRSRSARALKASQIFGAKCMRCILGGDPERPQIEMHIDNMIKAVRGLRSRIVDSGVKLAVENHGGDLQAREMKMMIEAVGADVMGVCLDSGNPVWMLEDPHMTLETLIPYAETCHVRDSAVWKVPEGIAVRWVNMGDGNVDIDGWIRKFIQAKPGLPIIFENLVSGASAHPRTSTIRQFWDNWRKMPAWEFSRFLAVAERARRSRRSPRPAGKSAGSRRSTTCRPRRPLCVLGLSTPAHAHLRCRAACRSRCRDQGIGPLVTERRAEAKGGAVADAGTMTGRRGIPLGVDRTKRRMMRSATGSIRTPSSARWCFSGARRRALPRARCTVRASLLEPRHRDRRADRRRRGRCRAGSDRRRPCAAAPSDSRCRPSAAA